MRYHEILAEAPIGDITFHGSDEPASMRADDIGIVTSDKGRAKIRRVLEKAPVLIHLAFVNHPWEYDSDEGIGDPLRTIAKPGGSVRASGVMTPERFEGVFGHPLTADPQAITVAFGFNEGNARMPLTPWVIAHRIGHAVNEARLEDRSGGPLVPLLMDLQRITINLPSDVVGHQSKEGHWVMLQIQDLLYATGTFKSARDGDMFSISEFVIESFAQFLVKGRIILNPVGTELPGGRLTPDARIKYAKLEDQNYTLVINKPDVINARMEAWRRQAEATFAQVLNSHLGEIVVL